MNLQEYRQSDLFDCAAGRSPDDVRAMLCRGAGRMDVDLVFTRNRVSMVTIAFPSPNRVKMRLHEAFLSAPDSVLQALREYICWRRLGAWQTVLDFARNIDSSTAIRGVNPSRLRSRGEQFDLGEIAEEVNAEFFGGTIRYRIGWGRARARRCRRSRSRSMRMGTWNQATKEIRIHPLLDDARVPREFMRYLVYHELLHAVVPSVRQASMRRDHPAEFRLRERRFPDIKRMHRLASELTEMLLR